MFALTRITHDAAVMGGKPCIRGFRVTVGTIVGLIAAGVNVESTTPEALRAFVHAEILKMRKSVKFSGATVD